MEASCHSAVVSSWQNHEHRLPSENFNISLSELMVPFVSSVQCTEVYLTFDKLRLSTILSSSMTWNVNYNEENYISSPPTEEAKMVIVSRLIGLTRHKTIDDTLSPDSSDEYTFSDKFSRSAETDMKLIVKEVKECNVWPEYLIKTQVVWSQMFLPLFLLTDRAPEKHGCKQPAKWNYDYASWCHYRILRAVRKTGSTDDLIKRTSAFFGRIMIEIIIPATQESDLQIPFSLDIPFIGKLLWSLCQSVLDNFVNLLRSQTITLGRLIELARTCFQARANLYATSSMGFLSQIEWFETVTTGALPEPDDFDDYCNEVQHITTEIKINRAKRKVNKIDGVHVLSNTGAKLNYTCTPDEQTGLKGTQKAVYDILHSGAEVIEYDLTTYDNVQLREKEELLDPLISATEEPGKYVLHHCIMTCTMQIDERNSGSHPDAPLEFLKARHSMVKEVKKVRGISVGSAPWAILLNVCHSVLASLIHFVPECEDAFKGGDLAWQFEKRIHADSWVYENDLITISTDLQSATDFGQWFCSRLATLFVDQLKEELGLVHGLLMFCIEYYFGPRWLEVPKFDSSLKTHPDESIRNLYKKFSLLTGTFIPTARMWPMAEGMTKFMLFLAVLVCLRKTARETGSEYRADINGDDLIALVLGTTFWPRLKQNLEGLGLRISIKDTAVSNTYSYNKYVYSEVFTSLARHRLAVSCIAQRSYTATSAANIGLTFNRKVLTPGKKGGFTKKEDESDYFGDPQGRFRSVSDIRGMITHNQRDINSYNLFVLVNTLMSNIRLSTGIPFLPTEFCGNDLPYPMNAAKASFDSGIKWFIRVGGRIPTHERRELVRQHLEWRKNVLRPFEKFRLLSDGSARNVKNHLDALELIPIDNLHPRTSSVINAIKSLTPLLTVNDSTDYFQIFKAECLLKTGGVISSRQVHAAVLAVDNTNKMRFGTGSHEEALEQCLENLELAQLQAADRVYDLELGPVDHKDLLHLITSHVAAPKDVRFFEGNVIFSKSDIEPLTEDMLFCPFPTPSALDVEDDNKTESDYYSSDDEIDSQSFPIPCDFGPDWTSPQTNVDGDTIDIAEQCKTIMSASNIKSIYELIGRFRIASDPAIYSIINECLTLRPDITSIRVITADFSLFNRGLRKLNARRQKEVNLDLLHPADVVNEFLGGFFRSQRERKLPVKLLPDVKDIIPEVVKQFNQRGPISWALLRLLEKDCTLLLRGERAHFIKDDCQDRLWIPDWGSLKAAFWTTYIAYFEASNTRIGVPCTYQCRSVVSNGTINFSLSEREYESRAALPTFLKFSRHFTVDYSGILKTAFQHENVPIKVVPI